MDSERLAAPVEVTGGRSGTTDRGTGDRSETQLTSDWSRRGPVVADGKHSWYDKRLVRPAAAQLNRALCVVRWQKVTRLGAIGSEPDNNERSGARINPSRLYRSGEAG